MSHDRQMALGLRAAEQAGHLSACLAWITLVEFEERGYARKDSFTASHWWGLDGRKLAWEPQPVQDCYQYMQDIFVQGEHWFNKLEPDREERYWGSHMGSEDGSDDDQFGLQKWKSRVGFVVWPRKSRWAVFVREGAATAFTQLRLMVAALDTPESSAAITTEPSLPRCNSMFPVQTAQEEHTASDRSEIALLISAMYQGFNTSWRVFDEHKVPGFDSFGELAIAFGLPHVEPEILVKRSNDSLLDPSLAEELLRASKLLGWASLRAIFDRLVHNTVYPDGRRREPLVKQTAAGFEALLLLLGEADADMQLVIPAQAAKLVTPLQKLSLSTRLSQITPGSGVIFTLRDWPYLPGSDVEDWASKLVVLALKLFQLLSVKEHTSKLTIESSTDEAACAFVDMVLADSRTFDASAVLAPACIQMAEASLGSNLLPEFPAAIKLVAGCVRELQQAAQLQPTLAAEGLCQCDTCQYLQAFLCNPDQRMCTIELRGQATHVIMQMQRLAKHHGHLCMEQDRSDQLLCSKESYNERSERVQQANAVLPQIQPIFNQVITSLFLRSGRAPYSKSFLKRQVTDQSQILHPTWKSKPMRQI